MFKTLLFVFFISTLQSGIIVGAGSVKKVNFTDDTAPFFLSAEKPYITDDGEHMLYYKSNDSIKIFDFSSEVLSKLQNVIGGRYITPFYYSNNENLLLHRGNGGAYGVNYLYNTSTTENINTSIGPNGSLPDCQVRTPSIDKTHNWIAFASCAKNWGAYIKFNDRLFLRNLDTQTTIAIDRNHEGGLVNGKISGKKLILNNPLSVIYSSSSTDILDENDTNGKFDIYMYDINTQTTKRVSKDENNNQLTQHSFVLSEYNGTLIFETKTSIYGFSEKIYKYELTTDTVTELFKNKYNGTIRSVSKDGNRVLSRVYDGMHHYYVYDRTLEKTVKVAEFRSAPNSIWEHARFLGEHGDQVLYIFSDTKEVFIQTLSFKSPPTPNAGTDQNTTIGQHVKLSASASSDSDGNITAYEWKEGDTVLSTDENFTKTDFGVGTHTITLTVTDDDNNSASDEVVVAVAWSQESITDISLPATVTDTLQADIEKVYSFTLYDKATIVVDAGETTDVALRGYVYDANGTKVSSIADWSKGKNNQLKIEKVLDAGEYVLKVFASADGDFSMEVKTYVVDPDTAWSVIADSQYTIHKNKLFTKTFRIEQNTHDANYENLIVTVTGSNDVHLDVQKKDEKGADLEEYRYKLVGTLTDSTDITLNIADSSQSFSISLPVRLKVGDFEIKAVFPNNPMIIANGDDITYPLSVAFDAIVPSGSTVKPTCRITVPWDGSTKTIDLPARQIGDNLQRYKCGMYDHDGNAYYLSVVAHMDEISLDIGFEDIESPYETVTAPVFKRDMVTAKATLEYMHEYEAEALVHSEDTYVIVNQRIYSANAASIPDIIYLGGENALHGTRKFNKDTVFLQGGIWKLTYGGHEVIIETHLDVLLGLGRVSSQLAFTVDGSSDITQNSDVVKFIIDPESTYRMLVKKSPVISRMRRFLSSGQLWQMASTLHSSNIHIDECEIPNSPLSVAQALSFDSHPCVQMNADGNNILAGVRGTTFTIEKKKNKPLVFNLIEGEIELSSTSLEGNITLHDMESLDLNQTVKTSINTNVLTPLQEKYLEDTSLNTADENTSIGSISITTNLSNASYMLVGDNVQAGNGKVSVFENVTEGSYDLQFLPVLGFVTPDNIKIILSKVNLDKQYAVVYKIDTDNDGVTDSIDAFPNDPNESVDTDHDGIGNNADTDDDNDGVLDVNDALPLNPNESVDTDHDGIGNNADKDDDNDGISDVLEVANGLNPLNASDGEADFDNDGFTNSMEISVGTDIRSASSKPVWTPIMMGDIIIFVPAKP